jgi:hypothetical protein
MQKISLGMNRREQGLILFILALLLLGGIVHAIRNQVASRPAAGVPTENVNQ